MGNFNILKIDIDLSVSWDHSNYKAFLAKEKKKKTFVTKIPQLLFYVCHFCCPSILPQDPSRSRFL